MLHFQGGVELSEDILLQDDEEEDEEDRSWRRWPRPQLSPLGDFTRLLLPLDLTATASTACILFIAAS